MTFSAMSSNRLGIGILGDELLAFLEEVGDVDDVRLVDESGEVLGEVLLILRHVAQFPAGGSCT